MKGAKVVHKSCKFHLHLTCSSWLFNLQMFSYLQKAGVKPPFNPTFFSSGRIKIIRESLPCLPKLHPSGAQIKKNIFKWNKIFECYTRSQESPKDPNWPQMSWKQPQSGQGFLKYLPVMHVSVKDMLRILKRCKNNKSLVVANFHKTFETQSITPYKLLSNFMANDRSHKVT